MKSDSVAVEEQQARTDARGSEAAHGSTSDCFRAPGYLTSSHIISVREFCRPGGFFDRRGGVVLLLEVAIISLLLSTHERLPLECRNLTCILIQIETLSSVLDF